MSILKTSCTQGNTSNNYYKSFIKDDKNQMPKEDIMECYIGIKDGRISIGYEEDSNNNNKCQVLKKCTAEDLYNMLYRIKNTDDVNSTNNNELDSNNSIELVDGVNINLSSGFSLNIDGTTVKYTGDADDTTAMSEISRICEALESLIKYVNGNTTDDLIYSSDLDNSIYVCKVLKEIGIDTSKPFTVNNIKFEVVDGMIYRS